MNDQTRLTQVRIVSQGPIERIEGSQDAARISFKQAVRKWADRQDEVKDLPWSQVPDGMLRDFLQAAAGDLSSGYGAQAQRKALEVLGITMAEKGLRLATIGAGWPQSGARIDIQMQVRPIQDSEPAEVGVEFTLEGPEADDDEVRDALKAVANKTGQERLLLDPGSQVPEEDLRRLVANMEQLIGDGPDEQISCLLGAAAVLVIWEHMEKLNAQTSDVTLSSLYSDGNPILEGMEVVLTAVRVALDRSRDAEANPEPAVQVSTVRVPKH